jgi:2-phospho-L-lactate guanylyltransferase
MRAALIPVGELASAKTRLAGVLDAPARQALTLAMLSDVIRAIAGSERFDEIAAISRDSEARWHAREAGARPLAEPATGTGLNDGLTFGVRYLARRVGHREVVILPADIPLVTSADIGAICDAFEDDAPRCVIVRARDGGTNALALRPPEAIPMRFGVESAAAHVAEAQAAGIDVVELQLERVAFDVDAPEDLAALASLDVGPATRRWLAEHARGGTG